VISRRGAGGRRVKYEGRHGARYPEIPDRISFRTSGSTSYPAVSTSAEMDRQGHGVQDRFCKPCLASAFL